MKTILLTGNGFNYLVNDWINNIDDEDFKKLNIGKKNVITSEINNITKLWEKFDEIFNEIRSSNNQLNDEELIRIIYSVIDLFSNLPGLKKIMDANQIELLKSLFSSFLLDKIKSIAQEFKNHHNTDGYKNLKKIFPDFGKRIKDIIEKESENTLNIFTTNYDGILDTLLTLNPYGFYFRDGFGPGGVFKDENFDSNQLFCHIHGSYLYKKSYGQTLKIANAEENTDPIMIFNNPNIKGEIISRDSVLSKYLNKFNADLKIADNLIIIGNSMKSEPHLKSLINKVGNRESLKIYVCSRNPSAMTNELKNFYKFDFNEVNTNSFKDPNTFFSFIDRIIN